MGRPGGPAGLEEDLLPEALPLQGVRVIELSANIAGPYAAMVLADLGAEVLKVEPPGGDDARRMAPAAGNRSAYFDAVNRNKSSIVLDLKSDGGRARFDSLLAGADVMVTNLRVGSLEGLGAGPEAILSAHPRLIYADISAYGAEGPCARCSGYDSVLQARSGLLSVTGEPDGPPVRVGVSILDMGSGMWLAIGVLCALRQRDSTGRGVRVSTSLLETGAGFLAYHLAALQMTGVAPSRQGTGHPSIEPYGVFDTAEGGLSIGVGGDRVFARLCATLGAPELSGDQRFSSNAGRVVHRSELRHQIENLLSSASALEWESRLADADVPASHVASVPMVLEDDQLDALGVWQDQPAPGGGAGELRLPGSPVRIGGRRPPLRHPPPPLGEGPDGTSWG